jgi:formate-dependent nitrite reductase cytochrome c552 subunit
MTLKIRSYKTAQHKKKLAVISTNTQITLPVYIRDILTQFRSCKLSIDVNRSDNKKENVGHQL